MELGVSGGEVEKTQGAREEGRWAERDDLVSGMSIRLLL